MNPNPIPGSHEELRTLLDENLRLSKAIYASTEKTRKYIFWGEVMSFLRILIIVVPLIIAFIYLKPLILQTMQFAQQVLGPGTLETSGSLQGTTDIMGIIKELQKQGVLPAQPKPNQ